MLQVHITQGIANWVSMGKEGVEEAVLMNYKREINDYDYKY